MAEGLQKRLPSEYGAVHGAWCMVLVTVLGLRVMVLLGLPLCTLLLLLLCTLLAIHDSVARSREFGKAVACSQINSLSCCNCGLDVQANTMLRPLTVLLLLLCITLPHLTPPRGWLVMLACCDGRVL